MGLGAKSYMRKGFLIYEEMHKYFHNMRWLLVIYDFAAAGKYSVGGGSEMGLLLVRVRTY